MPVVVVANPWESADAVAWTRRVPRRLRLVAAPAVLVAAIVASVALPASEPSTLDAATAQSPSYVLDAVAISLTLAALLLCWLGPRGGALTGLVGALIQATEPDGQVQPVWAAAALLLGVLVAADGLALLRQRLAAERWPAGPPVAPALDPGLVAEALRTPVWRRVVAVVLGVAAVGGVALFVHDDRAAREFRARATTLDGTVVSVTDDELDADVAIGARTVRVPVVDVPNVGAAVRVTTDGHRAELADQVFDPTGALLLATIGAVGAAWLVGADRARRARLTALLAGAPGVEAVLVAQGVDDLVLAPVDDAWAALELRVVAPPGRHAIGPAAPTPDPLLATLGNEELLAAARSALAAAATTPLATRLDPAWPTGSRVTVVGLVDDLSPVAVQGPDGTWVLAPAPVRVPGRRFSPA